MADSPFRFAWRRRPGRDREVYDAHLEGFHIGSIRFDSRYGIGDGRWIWRIPIVRYDPSRSYDGDTSRDCALLHEAAFDEIVAKAPQFEMRTEAEVELRALLGLPHPPALDYRLAVDRGEHVRPITPTHSADWDRWLKEERRRGNRNWISPEDMREWFGDAWKG